MEVLNRFLSAGLQVSSPLPESHQFVTSFIIFSASCLPLHLMSYFTSVINELFFNVFLYMFQLMPQLLDYYI